MFAAAVYLDHHWIVDAIAGWLVGFVAVVLARRALKARERWRQGSLAAPEPASHKDLAPEWRGRY
jgi:membrane-associated phospholipid phosphatase